MTRRGALDLLKVYDNNSSSEDDVPFGRVSTKRCHKSDSDTDEEKPKKVLQSSIRLSLPDIIKQEKEEYLNHPELHEGRIRSFPHERGNWATYIYIPYESNEDMQYLTELICGKLNKFNFKPINDFHISLTKVVILRHHWIESFITSVKRNVTNINRFLILLDRLNVYCNEERTRTFIGLEIQSGYDSLLNLVAILNQCLGEFNLPKFYEDPSFHMSLVWCVGDVEEDVRSILAQMNQEIIDMRTNSDDHQVSYIVVNKLRCKIGNKFFNFDIPAII